MITKKLKWSPRGTKITLNLRGRKTTLNPRDMMSRVRHNLPSLLSDTITAPKLPKKQAAGSDRTDGQVDTGPGVMAHNRRKRNALPLGRDGPARPINKAPVQRKQQQYGKTREDGDEFYTFASRYLAKPFKMGRAVFHIITHAFFTCFGAASLFSLYLYGCQVLGQAVMLVVQNPAKRDAITSDTSAIDSWATKYFTERNTKTTGIFVLLNLWSIMCSIHMVQRHCGERQNSTHTFSPAYFYLNS